MRIDEVIKEIESRRNTVSVHAVTAEIIAGVRARGDAFVGEQIEKYDGVRIAPILIAPEKGVIDPALARAIEIAIERIESFHMPQKPASYRWERNGTTIEHRVQPVRRAGVYVPGGRAVYLSTLIMCAVPARIAGVEEIVVATTPSAAARPELRYAASLLGVREIYRAGGATGIAAMALGTESLERVDKIVGPGNSYVTSAKAQLIGEVGIDMTAGPTELIVIADETANPEFVAADLRAQAEHGPDSAVICVATSERVARSIDVPGVYLVVASAEDGIALSNRLAPEHLSIQTRDASALAAKAMNCGAIYCGSSSAPAAGDYILGSNHVLPTAGTARFFSPLGVYDFVKRTNIATASAQDVSQLAPHAELLALFEGLPLHGDSIAARRQKVPA